MARRFVELIEQNINNRTLQRRCQVGLVFLNEIGTELLKPISAEESRKNRSKYKETALR